MNINGVPITTCSDEDLRSAFDAIGKAISTGPEAFAQYYAIERELERRSGASTPEQEKPTMADAAEMLWVVLANVSGGDWSKQTPDWQEYAGRWRDYYFAAMKLAASPSPPETQEPCKHGVPDAGLDCVLCYCERAQADALAPPETCAWRDVGDGTTPVWATQCGHLLKVSGTYAVLKVCPVCTKPLSLSSGGTPK